MQCFYVVVIVLVFPRSESYVLRPGIWDFRGHPIAFEKADFKDAAPEPTFGGNVNDDAVVDNDGLPLTSSICTPILLLNGFGVGSFHQHRLVQEIFKNNQQKQDHRQIVYCIDYLGQGRSWPQDCQDGHGPFEANLRYCGQTWVDQVTSFIEEIILNDDEQISEAVAKRKVHIVGNSVGGHLAVFVAAQRPDLVESLALLNPTPVWGLNLPGWNGRLPAPWFPKIVGRYLFDRIRDLKTIETYLEAAYFNRAAYDRSLIQQIRDCTELSNGGHAAFASILWSPPINLDGKESEEKMFYQALASLDCDVLMLFGRDDPWCKPAFARRMLEQTPEHVATRYVELSNVGHCPNNEAPTATAFVLQAWWQLSREGRITGDPWFVESNNIVQEEWGQTQLMEKKSHEIELSLLDRVAVSFV
ncbi:hypothetical protein ACA910_010838 [Epithemia clementina (nom. ined.)]